MNGPAVHYHDQHGHAVHPLALWHHRPSVGDRVCARGSHRMYEVVTVVWMSSREVHITLRPLQERLRPAA
ncbi:MAG: hypothetical protein AAF730_13415 [Bacteroidota bacterium]